MHLFLQQEAKVLATISQWPLEPTHNLQISPYELGRPIQQLRELRELRNPY